MKTEKEETYTLSTHVNKSTFDKFYDLCYVKYKMSKSALLKKLVLEAVQEKKKGGKK